MGLLLVVQYAVAVVSSGFNSWYFWRYRPRRWSRRLAGWTLALLNLGVCFESAYFGFRAWVGPRGTTREELAAGLVTTLGVLAVSALILRRRGNGSA